MINDIYVDGFRSLSSFSMSVKPGLNMLVGPNGSGKTNIILFFEFLSHVSSEMLGEAVSRCGGAGSIFQKVGKQDFVNNISSRIQGGFSYRSEGVRRNARYACEFSIAISDERDSIFYSSQRFCFVSHKGKQPKKDNWDLDISIFLDSEDEYRVQINRIDLRKLPLFQRIFQFRDVQAETRAQKLRFIEAHVEHMMDSDTNFLFALQRIHRDFGFVLNDLVGGEAFNIMPSAAREAEDSATPPGIRKDGSGLAATLFALKQSMHHRRSRIIHRWINPAFIYGAWRHFPRRMAGEFRPRFRAFERIVEFVRIANDQIEDLDVFLDHTDNKIKIITIIKDENGRLELPFSLMSDGTVKWISLIAAIFTYESIFAIEEPENFIHPLMQKEIVEIMRGASREKGFKSFVLMTTHSETLLNAAMPDEVLVVSMAEGITRANRPQHRKLLEQEISRTGFGLGHYYLTGALDDA